MWYFKTLLGTFWIVPAEGPSQKYFLGLDDDALGAYLSYKDALNVINTHTTGHFHWDTHPKMLVPKEIEQWSQGEPLWWTKDVA